MGDWKHEEPCVILDAEQNTATFEHDCIDGRHSIDLTIGGKCGDGCDGFSVSFVRRSVWPGLGCGVCGTAGWWQDGEWQAIG